MAKRPVESESENGNGNGDGKIHVRGFDKAFSIKRWRRLMDEITEEAASLREDDSSAAKNRRVQIASDLRAIQDAIDKTEPLVEVVLGPRDCVQWPFRIGPVEFWPGTHTVRASVAQILRHMVDQHKAVELNRTVHGGDGWGESYGKEVRLG